MDNKFSDYLNKYEREMSSEEFWGEYFKFAHKKLRCYFQELKSNGLDPVLLTTINKEDIEESTPKRLKRSQEILIALSKLTYVLDNKKLEEENNVLKKEVEKRDAKIKENKNQMQEAKEYIKNQELKINTQEKQLKKKLTKNLKMARDRIRMIADEINQKDKTFGYLMKMVDIFEENDIWPETERKPTKENQNERKSVEYKTDDIDKESLKESKLNNGFEGESVDETSEDEIVEKDSNDNDELKENGKSTDINKDNNINMKRTYSRNKQLNFSKKVDEKKDGQNT